MGRTILGVGTALVMVALVALQPNSDSAAAQGRRTPAGTRFSGKAFRFNQVKPGIYHAVGTGALTVVGNSSVIVNDQDVVVVDDHISPAAAWALLDEVKALTNKPVRTVINTHFHFDHAHGNQISGPTWTSSATSSRARCCSAAPRRCRSSRTTSPAFHRESRISSVAWPPRPTPRGRPRSKCSFAPPRTTSRRRQSFGPRRRT